MLYKTIKGDDVPALGLGTWELRGATCREAVAHALGVGYRHIDTAQMYENEGAVGQAITNSGVDRDAIFLTTKVWPTHLAPADVHRTTDESLRRLRTEYVDLLLIHWPSDAIPLEQTLDAMLALQDAGKTRHVGVSNFTPSLLQRADHAPIFCNQVEYHPFLAQDELLDMARAHDLLLTAYSPIAQGQVKRNDTLHAIGEAHGKTPVQVTLRWLIQQDQVAAIPRSSTAAHRKDNVDVFDFALSDEEMERIQALSRNERLVDPAHAPAWEYS